MEMFSPCSMTTPAQYRSEPIRRLVREDRFLAITTVLALPATVGRWLKRRHTRQVLAALDEHQLRDIGLTRTELSTL